MDVGYDTSVFISASIDNVFHDHRRGDRPRRHRDLLLPALDPRHRHPDRHHPGLAGRRLHADVGARLHDQHAHAAGHGAGGRPRGRRRDRHAREHQPPRRGRGAALPGRAERGARDRLRDRRHDAHAGGRLRADRLPDRPHRAPLHRVRAQPRRRRAGLGLRGALALADDVLAAAAPRASGTGVVYRTIERGLDGLTDGYRRALRFALHGPRRCRARRRSWWPAPATRCSWPSPPSSRRSRTAASIVRLGFAPEGSTIDYTDHYAKRIEDALASKRPLVERIFLVIGFGGDVTRAIGFARLVDWDKRTLKQQQIVGPARPRDPGIPGLLAFPTNPPSLGQSPVDKPVQFVLDVAALRRAAEAAWTAPGRRAQGPAARRTSRPT